MNAVNEYFPDRHFMFLSLPIMTDSDWPEWVYEKANDLKVTVEQIVEAEKLTEKESRTVTIRYHRSIIEDRIAFIAQSVITANLSVIQFTTGEAVLVNMPNEDLTDYIEYFIFMPEMDGQEEKQPEPVNPQIEGQKKKIKKND